jgi:hypothetical protein
MIDYRDSAIAWVQAIQVAHSPHDQWLSISIN